MSKPGDWPNEDTGLFNQYRIDQVCDQFEAEWRQGRRPDIAHFLERVPPENLPTLLGELLWLEWDWQARQGEAVQVDAYLTRFPEATDTIRTKFAEFMAAKNRAGADSLETDRDGAGHDATAVFSEKPRATTADRTSATNVRQTIGGYELLEMIGKGGMGVVYKARQQKLDRIVALKMIQPGQFGDPRFVQRFQAEAAAAAKLNHPGIVQVFDVGEEDGCHFFSMTYVDGPNLTQLVSERPLANRRAAEILRCVAEAMETAHASGLIHRDLKPANVLMADDHPQVTDFGLAKLIAADSQLTSAGDVLGTPSYMPPEQATGDVNQVGIPADIYSMGAILYHLLCGRPPFQAASPFDTLTQVIEQEPVPPRRFNPQVDLDLETICLKCLEKEPSRRYHTSAELAADLRRYLAGEPIVARPIGAAGRLWRWCKRQPVVAALSALAVALLIGGAFISTYYAIEAAGQAAAAQKNLNVAIAAKNKADEKTAEAIANERQATELRKLAESRESLARERLEAAYVGSGWRALEQDDPAAALLWHTEALRTFAESPGRDREDIKSQVNHRIRIAQMFHRVAKPPLRLPHQRPVRSIVYSHDGQWLATADGGKSVQVWNTTTGAPLEAALQHDEAVSHVAFNADDSLLAAASGNRVYVWELATRKPLLDPLPHDGGVSSLAFAPQGKLLLTGSADQLVRLWDLTTGKPAHEPRRYCPPGFDSPVLSVAFSSDGTKYAASGRTNFLTVWDTQSGEAITEPVVTDVAGNVVEFSPDGKHVLVAGQPGSTLVVDIAAGKPLFPPIKSSTFGNFIHAAYSPDGTRIVTSYQADLFSQVWDAHSGAPITKTGKYQQPIIQAVFSPDGQRVAACATDGIVRIWNSATGAAVSDELVHDRTVKLVRFRPDGQQLATACDDGIVRLWPVNKPTIPHETLIIDADAHRHLVPAKLAFSRTGDRLLAQYNDGWFCLWDTTTLKPKSSFFQIVLPFETYQLSPDGRYLLLQVHPEYEKPGPHYFNRRDFAPFLVDLQAAAPQPKRFLPPLENQLAMHVGFSPDSRQIALTAGTEVHLIDTATGSVAGTIKRERKVELTAFDPHGKLLVALDDAYHYEGNNYVQGDAHGQVYNVATLQPLSPPFLYQHREYARQMSYYSGAAISGSGEVVAAMSANAEVSLWRAKTGEAIAAFPPDAVETNSLELDETGRRLLRADQGGTIRLFDATNLQPLTPPIKLNRLAQTHFSSDERRLTVNTNAGNHSKFDREPTEELARLYDAANAQAITPNFFDGQVAKFDQHGVFNRNGNYFAGINGQNQVTLRKIEPLDWPLDDLLDLAYLFAQRKVDPTGALGPLEEAETVQILKRLQARYQNYFAQPLK